MNTPAKATAVAYFRTSSATNVGADKDSMRRQAAAVEACAAARGLQMVCVYFDAAVSGGDPVDSRPGFAAMMQHLLSNGCRTIVVENASRFARDLIVQETGYRMLKDHGIDLIAADSPDSFLSDGPSAVLIRQILGAVSQFEKTMLVNKLRGARDRKSAALGRRVEGAKWVQNQPSRYSQETLKAARAAQARGLSLRAIATALAKDGHRNADGKVYGPQSVRLMLAR